ncbi:hypothetical protein KP509_35G011800 [Ceratopteris richardii]|nr:hypothetical protein KP509_35G011800 [Ceratopteris richardii]
MKELSKLWNKVKDGLPWNQGDYGPSNTLLVDDTPYKAVLNPPNTAIFPRSYTVQDHGDTFLRDALRSYLEGIRDAESVPTYVKRNPFGEPSIGPENPLWSHISKLLIKAHCVFEQVENGLSQPFGAIGGDLAYEGKCPRLCRLEKDTCVETSELMNLPSEAIEMQSFENTQVTCEDAIQSESQTSAMVEKSFEQDKSTVENDVHLEPLEPSAHFLSGQHDLQNICDDESGKNGIDGEMDRDNSLLEVREDNTDACKIERGEVNDQSVSSLLCSNSDDNIDHIPRKQESHDGPRPRDRWTGKKRKELHQGRNNYKHHVYGKERLRWQPGNHKNDNKCGSNFRSHERFWPSRMAYSPNDYCQDQSFYSSNNRGGFSQQVNAHKRFKYSGGYTRSQSVSNNQAPWDTVHETSFYAQTYGNNGHYQSPSAYGNSFEHGPPNYKWNDHYEPRTCYGSSSAWPEGNIIPRENEWDLNSQARHFGALNASYRDLGAFNQSQRSRVGAMGLPYNHSDISSSGFLKDISASNSAYGYGIRDSRSPFRSDRNRSRRYNEWRH